MWIITHVHTGKKEYLLSEKKKYVVGRLGSDIVISDDTSISRSHAIFHVTAESLRLEDLGSKYGTFCNENINTKKKLQKAKLFRLDVGGRILFGALKNEWQVSKSIISTMVSSLSEAQLNEVVPFLNSLGANIIPTWEPTCTHLTMSEITITIKVLHALIEKIPIVSCEYWKDYLKNIQDKKPPPATIIYLPKRSNKLSSAIYTKSFNFNDKRRTLFAGKTFVFMSKKHCDMYGPIVTKTGGECRDLKSNIHKSYLLQQNVIVIQYIPATQSQSSQTINTISEYLESNSLRTIPEYEIGLAIVCCNTEKYCNPSYNTVSHILSAGESLNIGTILVENTRPEKLEINILDLPSAVIPDSDCLKEKTAPYNIIQSEIYEEMHSESIRNSYGCLESSKKIECVAQTIQKESFSRSKQRLQLDENEKERKIENLSNSGEDVNNIKILNQNTSKFIQTKGKRNRSTDVSEELQLPKKLHTSNTSDGDICENYNRYVKSQKNDLANQNTSKKDNEMNDLLVSPNIRTANSQSNTRFSSFLQKSHCSSKNIKRQQINKAELTKQGRIARITDDDSENEDDIFNFGGPAKKLKTSDEEIFVVKPEDAGTSSENNTIEKKLSKTQSLSSNNKLASAEVTESKIKITPLKFESEGWLSKLKMLNIKKEEDINIELENEYLKQDEWIDSIRGGFEVKVRKMNLSVRGSYCSTNRYLTNATITPFKKNFKAFVKIRNYKPQTVIVRTVPVVVSPIH